MAIAGAGSFLKGLRGSMVNLTAKNFRGETVVQGKRTKGQSNPSLAFLQAQASAALLSSIYRLIATAVRTGFTSKASNQSEYNAWYSDAYNNAVDISVPGTATLIPASFKTARGIMTPTTGLSFTADTSLAQADVGYDNFAADASQLTTDLPILVVHNRTQDKWLQVSTSPATRASGIVSFDPTDNGFSTTGNVLDAYLAFIGAPSTGNAGTTSTSVYASTTQVA